MIKERSLVVKQRADVITRAHCCVDCCVLNKLGWQKGRDVVYGIMKSRDSMTRDESKNDLRVIVRVCSQRCIYCVLNIVSYLCAFAASYRNAFLPLIPKRVTQR